MSQEFGQLRDIVEFKVTLGYAVKRNEFRISDFKNHLKNLTGHDIISDDEYYEKIKEEVKVRYKERVGFWGNKVSYMNSTLDNMFRSNEVYDLVVQLFELAEIVNSDSRIE